MANLIQSLKSHSPGKRTITNNSNYFIVFSLQVSANRLAQCKGKTGAAVPGIVNIKFGFVLFWETAYSLIFSYPGKRIPSSGKNFMSITLMAHIPDNLVYRGVKNIVKGYG